MQPLQVGVSQRGVAADEVTQCGHVRRLLGGRHRRIPSSTVPRQRGAASQAGKMRTWPRISPREAAAGGTIGAARSSGSATPQPHAVPLACSGPCTPGARTTTACSTSRPMTISASAGTGARRGRGTGDPHVGNGCHRVAAGQRHHETPRRAGDGARAFRWCARGACLLLRVPCQSVRRCGARCGSWEQSAWLARRRRAGQRSHFERPREYSRYGRRTRARGVGRGESCLADRRLPPVTCPHRGHPARRCRIRGERARQQA